MVSMCSVLRAEAEQDRLGPTVIEACDDVAN